MSRMPQLRIAVTSPCGKACIYCRPGGEGTVSPKSKELTREELVYLTTLVQQSVKDRSAKQLLRPLVGYE